MGDDPNVYSGTAPEREPAARLALTIGEMAGRGWTVRAVCQRCSTYLWVDTATIIATAGPNAFFWGRQGQCKVMYGINRCSGRTRFEAKTPRGETWYSLDDQIKTARHLFQLRKR